MGWAAARKLRRAIDGLTRVLAIEILTAARRSTCGRPCSRAGHRRRAGALGGRVGGPGPTVTSPPRSRPSSGWWTTGPCSPPPASS